MSRRADDQAISTAGPLTAFCGVAVVAVGVIVGSTIQPAASSPHSEASPQVSQRATQSTSEPVRISLTPEQVDEMRIASNLVSGAAAPVRVPELSSVVVPVSGTAPARSAVSPTKTTKKRARNRTQPRSTRIAAVTSKARTSRVPAVASAKAKRVQDRVERRIEQRQQWLHKWNANRSHRHALKHAKRHGQRHGHNRHRR